MVRAMTLRGTPDARRRPADGIVAEASVVARLLRLRLLTLDATVVITPARVTAPSPPERPPSPPERRAAVPPGLDHPPAAHAAPDRGEPIGRRLTQAARTLDESAETLAALRRESASLAAPASFSDAARRSD